MTTSTFYSYPKTPAVLKPLAFVLFCLCMVLPGIGQIDWQPAFDITGSDFGNNRPRIALNGDGHPLVIWGGSGNLYYVRWTGETFTDPVKLNPPGMSIAEANWMGPEIASHGDTAYVTFKETPEDVGTSRIWLRYTYDGGTIWSDPVQVDQQGDLRSRFAAVTTDDDGHPLVGYMKFNASFHFPRWVVTRSSDHGKSFEPDVVASGWSSPASEACDCCPGTVVSSGNTVAMLYRDNNDNIRDSWAGISTDLGNTFNRGVNMDQNAWNINACPSSGPDGVILGDTLYAVFMSGASGMGRVYFNATDLKGGNPAQAELITGDIPDLNQQNYPRISIHGSKTVIVWDQIIKGVSQLPVIYTPDITTGFSAMYDTIALQDVDNPDVALTGEKVFVVWQDNRSKTIKARFGEFNTTSGTSEGSLLENLVIAPNPADSYWMVTGDYPYSLLHIEVLTLDGAVVYEAEVHQTGTFSQRIPCEGLISGTYILRCTANQRSQSVLLQKH